MDSFYDARADSLGMGAWKQVNAITPLHFHNSIELLYVFQGQTAVSVDGETRTIHEGDIMLANSFAVHSVDFPVNCAFYGVMIPRNLLPEWNHLLDNKTFAEPIISDDEKRSIGHLITLMYDIREQEGIFNGMFPTGEEWGSELRLLAAALMNIILRRCPLVTRQRITTPVADAVNYITNHYQEKLLVSDVAGALYCNTQRLSERFREVMHISIADYITSLRTVEAARLLTEYPELKLEEVAERSGFQSMRSMFRAIRERYGCTPAAMKRDIFIN